MGRRPREKIVNCSASSSSDNSPNNKDEPNTWQVLFCCGIREASIMAKVLVIDDEPGIRGIMCRALEAAGHDVTAFANGGGAIEHIRQEPADLLITDLFMPEVEGLETIREIRRLRPDMPIIAISGVD